MGWVEETETAVMYCNKFPINLQRMQIIHKEERWIMKNVRCIHVFSSENKG